LPFGEKLFSLARFTTLDGLPPTNGDAGHYSNQNANGRAATFQRMSGLEWLIPVPVVHNDPVMGCGRLYPLMCLCSEGDLNNA